MDFSVNQEFKNRVRHSYEESPFPSMSSASAAADCSPPTLTNILKGKFDHSKDGPGLFAMTRLATVLNSSLGHWAGQRLITPQTAMQILNGTAPRNPTDRPSLEDLIERYHRGGKRYEALAEFADYFDVYEVPEQGAHTVTIKQLGAVSLFALRLETSETKVAQEELDKAPQELRDQFLEGYHRIAKQGLCTEIFRLDRELVTKPKHINSEYTRLGLLVKNQHGADLIVIYCVAIPAW